MTNDRDPIYGRQIGAAGSDGPGTPHGVQENMGVNRDEPNRSQFSRLNLEQVKLAIVTSAYVIIYYSHVLISSWP